MVHVYTQHMSPADQSPLVTKSVQGFFAVADMLWRAERDKSVVGVVSGAAGTGKSTAAGIYQSSIEQEAQRPSFVCRRIVSPPFGSAKEFLDVLSQQVSGNSASSRTVREAFQRSIREVETYQVRLLILDQAERLTEKHMGILQALISATKCAFLLVGQQPITARIALYPSLADAIVCRVPFLPLTEEEVLLDVLPYFAIAGWTEGPAEQSAQELGKELWRRTSPSFRRLRAVLTCASHLAQVSGEAIITRQRIEHALHLMDLPGNSSARVYHLGSEEG